MWIKNSIALEDSKTYQIRTIDTVFQTVFQLQLQLQFFVLISGLLFNIVQV